MKSLKWIISFLLLTVITGLIIYNNSNVNNLPNFIFYDLNNRPFSKNELKGKETLIVYISTKCESCNEALQQVKELAVNHPNLIFIVVSSSDELPISKEKFLSNQIDSAKNIKLLYDKDRLFVKRFGLGFVIEYPTIFYSDGENIFKKIKDLRTVDDFIKKP
ncbi:TlpA family protein disulfide reductase [Pedobacter sp. UC225_61]|uniref:TlpA family protein disulfide reductase n=1 Tax=Pedobacter sp. UC225_61 TaxID=3374623 RepID=UPI00379D761E